MRRSSGGRSPGQLPDIGQVDGDAVTERMATRETWPEWKGVHTEQSGLKSHLGVGRLVSGFWAEELWCPIPSDFAGRGGAAERSRQ